MKSITNLTVRAYAEQSVMWPESGRHILAQFDEDSIVVYQAYRPAIAIYAVTHQRFGGEFSFNRMSWIKPNFLWMMYRSGWAMKAGQEYILAIRLRRAFFDEILETAVASSFGASRFSTQEEWKEALGKSDVRLQWDPDHDPRGNALERRAVQLGLRGNVLRRFGGEELLSIEDITPFVATQRAFLESGYGNLKTPLEQVYVPSSRRAVENIGLTEQPLECI